MAHLLNRRCAFCFRHNKCYFYTNREEQAPPLHKGIYANSRIPLSREGDHEMEGEFVKSYIHTNRADMESAPTRNNTILSNTVGDGASTSRKNR